MYCFSRVRTFTLKLVFVIFHGKQFHDCSAVISKCFQISQCLPHWLWATKPSQRRFLVPLILPNNHSPSGWVIYTLHLLGSCDPKHTTLAVWGGSQSEDQKASSGLNFWERGWGGAQSRPLLLKGASWGGSGVSLMPRVHIGWKLLTAPLEELEEVGGEMEAWASLHGWMDGVLSRIHYCSKAI